MVIFVILKWYKLLYYKEILSIYWMTLVSDEQPPHYFLILLSVALVTCVLELSSKQHRPRREKTCLLSFLNQSLRLNRLARN